MFGFDAQRQGAVSRERRRHLIAFTLFWIALAGATIFLVLS